jgi:hypothetical protein
MKLHRMVFSLAVAVVGAVSPLVMVPTPVFAAELPTVSFQMVSVPSRILGPISHDGRYALVSAGITVSVSDAMTGLSPAVGYVFSGGFQPVVEDMSDDGRLILRMVRAQGSNTTSSLEIFDRITSTTRTVATGIESISVARASMSDDGSAVAWSSGGGDHDAVWVRMGTAAPVLLTSGLRQDPWPAGPGWPLAGHFGRPAVSGDGTSVVFDYNNVDPPGCVSPVSCANLVARLLKSDSASGTRVDVGIDQDGLSTGQKAHYSVSADGRYVLWAQSNCLCWRDTQLGSTEALTFNTTGLLASENPPQMSADGKRVLASFSFPNVGGTFGLEPRLYETGTGGAFTPINPPIGGQGWCNYCGTALSGDGLHVWLSDSSNQGHLVTLSYAPPPPPPPPPPTTATFSPLTPGRLLDTRPGSSTVDGKLAGAGFHQAGSTLKVKVASRHGVPVGASAAALNITATGTLAGGYLTVWPCSDTQPVASNLNFDIGATIANVVISKLGTDGDVCIFSSATTHLLADLTGYFPAGSSFTALTPGRLLDTRPGSSTVDGAFAGIGAAPADGVLELDVSGRHGLPANASTAVLNLTVTDAASGGFITVWPCDEDPPNASNVNYDRGDTIANAVITKLASDGTVCIYASAPTHVVVDVAGYFPA